MMSGSDEGILARLVELDKKADAMVEEAQVVLDDTLSHIEEDTQQFRKSCAEKSQQRIGAIRDEANRASQAELENISRRYQSLTEELEKTYRERHAQWEEEIFRRCVQT